MEGGGGGLGLVSAGGIPVYSVCSCNLGAHSSRTIEVAILPGLNSQLSSLEVAVTEVGGGGLGMRLEQTVYIPPVQSAYCTCSFT